MLKNYGRFRIREDYLDRAGRALACHGMVFWVLGGSCSGKSTLCGHVADTNDVILYDMDEHIFGAYGDRYTRQKQPATWEWFNQENGLDWVLSLSWEEFDALNGAVAAEYLGLFAEDLSDIDSAKPLLVDGGLARPEILVRAIDPDRVVVLDRDEKDRLGEWERNETRREMKEMVERLPDGARKWRKFLEFDALLTRKMLEEANTGGIKVLHTGESLQLVELESELLQYFRI